MNKTQWVENLSDGMGIDDFFQVEICDLRQARNGSLYLHLVLRDRTGRVNARRWDARAEESEAIRPGDFIKVRGFVETYRGRPQVIVRQFQPAGEEADPADFLPTSSRAPETMLAELEEVLGAVKTPPLRTLLDAFLGDPDFRERLKTAPAGTRLHHAYLGGLLEHTLSMARCALTLASHYPVLDADRLLTGVFLHDLGKTEELSSSPLLEYSDRGRLLGHIEIGARLLAEKAARVEGFSPSLLDVLTHMILSHHGRTEYGSPKLPMTPEAVALHHLDNLDAKLASVEALMEKDERATWTEYVRGFERAFYLGGDGSGGGVGD